jgi:hypothetical protein
VLAFGLLATLPACTEAPLVQLTLDYAGFEPACVQVVVADSSGAAAHPPVPVHVPPQTRQGELKVAIYGQDGWGNELLIAAEAHELSCPGPIVSQPRATVPVQAGRTAVVVMDIAATDVDRDGFVSTANNGTDCDDAIAAVHPGAQELCNNRDDNCAGGVDEGFSINMACGDAGCGSIQCAMDGGSFCAPGLAFYPDGDMDGYGRTPEVTFACTAPAGFAPDAGDCDDSTSRAHPGLAEVCDGIDNDCVNGVDQGFSVDAGCTTPFGCAGLNACALDGGVLCQPTGGGTNLHPDDDEDGHGSPVEVCSADAGGIPLVMSADDCDDGDPFTAAGFPEICDRRDNDCDGQVDRFDAGTAACPAGAAWIAHQAGAAGHRWRSIWSWTDGGTWATGLAQKHRVHLQSDPYTPASPWTNYDGDCPNGDYTGIWADPLTGQSFVVGLNGATPLYCTHAITAPVRDQSALVGPNLAEPVSVVGFRNGSSVELYVAGRNGNTLRWLPDGGSQSLAPAPARLTDIHGTSVDNLFVSGVVGTATPPDARVFKFQPPNGWQVTPLPAGVRNTGASVEAVYAVSPRLAYAVTDAGSVLEWDGAVWGLHPAPPGGPPLRGVLAFGRHSLFVIDAQTAWEWNGTTWTKLLDAGVPTPSSLVDLHGTHPADIWVAQDPQMIYRWPQ